MQDKITPIPSKFGIGFVSNKPLPQYADKFRYEQVGMYHNYYVTPECWSWPLEVVRKPNLKIDGFSPNLNKTLHVGHLRNLAIANSLSRILNCKFVALLGASLGVKKSALDGWNWWTDFVKYSPKEYYDVVLPQDVVETHSSEQEGNPEVWDGPKGEVLVKRSDGRPLYAYYDLAFAEYIKPTHYITGHEQKEHFQNLGLDKKHLPMGLVLGSDGKKLKSRTGDALSASELIDLILEALKVDDRWLAWNVLAFNVLSSGRETNLKFDVKNWTNPNQGGLYITYTYARSKSALKGLPASFDGPIEADINLLGFASQINYYLQESINKFDPCPLANFALDLAMQINQAYVREQINGGRGAFKHAFDFAVNHLEECMKYLGMFLIEKV